MEASPTYQPGSAEDFDSLYRASYQRVLRTLTGIVGDRTTAEECVQEAFVRAFKAWPRWRPDAPAEAWVHRIAINVATSHRRREALRLLRERLIAVGREPTAPAPDRTESSDLLDAVRRLPAPQAAAIVLRHVHGYTNREIAAALGVAESTIASRLASARARLRTDLEGESAGMGTLEPSR
ncbi:MAG TPA: sigma-70 family RNA polymerase sigma factor [Candidatus Dormibacteraeota bacterium]|nr:sigma-70 family RNA polymerase sigma factor [Candidatus Dormibacteraeota bacterium]